MWPFDLMPNAKKKIAMKNPPKAEQAAPIELSDEAKQKLNDVGVGLREFFQSKGIEFYSCSFGVVKKVEGQPDTLEIGSAFNGNSGIVEKILGFQAKAFFEQVKQALEKQKN